MKFKNDGSKILVKMKPSDWMFVIEKVSEFADITIFADITMLM